MRIFGTLSVLIVAAIALYLYSSSIRSASAPPTLSAEDKALTAPLIAPSAMPSPAPGQAAWGHRPSLDTSRHGATTRDSYKDDLDRANEAADAMKQGRKDADDAGAF